MDEFPEGFDLAALLAPIARRCAGRGRSARRCLAAIALLPAARRAGRCARVRAGGGAARDPLSTPPPEWRTIRDLGLEAIAGHSKDLEIAGWLTEALLRSDGLPGFTAGVSLMTGLVEDFWDDLFPLPDEDGVGTRVRPVAGLNGQSGEGTLGPALRRVPLFLRPDGSPMPFWQFEQSENLRQDRRPGNSPEAHRCRRPAVRDRRKRGASRGQGSFRRLEGGSPGGGSRRGAPSPRHSTRGPAMMHRRPAE